MKSIAVALCLVVSVLVGSVAFESVASAQDEVQRQDSREVVKKLAFKRHLKQLARAADRETAAKIRQVLTDDELFSMAYAGFVGERYNPTEIGDGSIIEALQQLLEYLIENQDELIEFIEKLLDLWLGFSVQVEQAQAAAPPFSLQLAA